MFILPTTVQNIYIPRLFGTSAHDDMRVLISRHDNIHISSHIVNMDPYQKRFLLFFGRRRKYFAIHFYQDNDKNKSQTSIILFHLHEYFIRKVTQIGWLFFFDSNDGIFHMPCSLELQSFEIFSKAWCPEKMFEITRCMFPNLYHHLGSEGRMTS